MIMNPFKIKVILVLFVGVTRSASFFLYCPIEQRRIDKKNGSICVI